jgi:small GTP-binding protein
VNAPAKQRPLGLGPVLRAAVVGGWVLALAACSSGPERVKPADLPPPASRASAQLIWSTQVGASVQALAPFAHQGRVYLAGGGGTVAVVDATSGKDVWRLNLGTPLSTGAGSDGELTAVVTQGHQLVALSEGKELWRAALPAASYTSPLVAGKRVFVQTADRSVAAFDGRTGARLWVQSRPGEPLVLRQAGVLLALGDTLVSGLSGRLVGLNPNNGSPRWEVPIANSRGTNEVERLVDLVGPVSRMGAGVCARSSVKPVIALVGRPNVGKSTLFNRLTGTRDAIVADFRRPDPRPPLRQRTPGRREFIVIDTGGFEPDASEGIYKEMAKQTRQAVAESDVVLFVVDARAGLSAQDHEIAQYLRRWASPRCWWPTRPKA